MRVSPKVVVVGATGFVGRAVVDALKAQGAVVTTVRAPRLEPVAPEHLAVALQESHDVVDELAHVFDGATVVVNAAGDPDASGRDEAALMAANALLPAAIATAARQQNVQRFVHVSSAVVQGNIEVLDESTAVFPFSAYSRSKARGEQLVHLAAADLAVVYRPPSVHAQDRRVSTLMARLARSPLATVARPESSPTPQALLQNVADAIAFLALCPDRPPPVVIHPSEGLTTSTVLFLLSGRTPKVLPRWFARLTVASLVAAGRLIPAVAANARRVELLWFGQGQARSWLTDAGWLPPAGHEAWRQLGQALAQPRPHVGDS